jgi:hypothetical protein
VSLLWWLFAVPGDPQDVRATFINSTAIRVQWRPPLEKDRNGIIRGYHIHVQETKEEVCTKYVIGHMQTSSFALLDIPYKAEIVCLVWILCLSACLSWLSIST